MTLQENPRREDLAAELARLEGIERQLSDDRANLHTRMDIGLPPTMTTRTDRQASAGRLSLHRRIERQLSDERLALHQRIDLLRAELSPRA